MMVSEGRQRGERVGGMPPMDFVADVPRMLLSSGVVAQLWRYAIVSAVALGVDFAVFLGLNWAVGWPTLTGVLGYACGIVVHYHLSKRFVFEASGSAKSARRRFSEFVASGLIGLAATAGVIAVATAEFGLDPIGAKAMAVGASFLGVFLIRRTVVFA